MSFDIEHVEWCKQMFESLSPGGVWGVPRSGLVFRKVTSDPRTPLPLFVLDAVLPYDPAVYASEEKWRAYQREDLEGIRTHFGAAGIEVRGEIEA